MKKSGANINPTASKKTETEKQKLDTSSIDCETRKEYNKEQR